MAHDRSNQHRPCHPAGGSQNPSEVNYSYTAAGQRLNLTDPAGNTTTWNYDALGRVTSEVISLNNLARNFTYDEAGRLKQKTDRLDRVTKYEYNVFDQVIAEKWYETNGTTLVRTISSTYDDAGQLTHSGDVDAASQPLSAAYDYLYDLLGRRTDETQDIANLSDDILYESQYDRNGFRLDLQATIGTTKDFHNVYTPDNLQRLQTLVQDEVSGGNDVAAKRLAFTYNNASQLDSISRYAAATATNLRVNSFYEYDKAGRLAQLTHTTDTTRPTAGTFGAGALAGHIYTFDAANRISSRESLWRTNSTPQFTGTTSYTYGDDDQLIGEDRDWSGQSDVVWGYDDSGNRVEVSGYNATINYSWSKTYTIDDMNRLASDGWFDYEYDEEGNVTAKASSNAKYEYDWDWRDRLTAVRSYNGSGGSNWTLQWEIRYAYDLFNQLVRRDFDNGWVDAHYYAYESGQMAYAFEYYGQLTQRFVWGPEVDQLLVDEFESGGFGAGEIYYPLGDHQNTIQDAAKYIPSASATKVVTHRYGDAWGTGGSYSAFEGIYYDGSLFAFTGRFMDNMTGLQWHLNRWYDHNTGRWMSEDPIGFDGDPWNLYRYVANSPLTHVDPSGLQSVSLGAIVVKKAAILDRYGAAQSTVRWTVPGTFTGWIVQHVKFTWSVNSPNAMGGIRTVSREFEYWEGWQVVSGVIYVGAKASGSGLHRGDTFRTATKGPCSSGSMSIQGDAMFVTGVDADIAKWGKIPEAGSLPATKNRPIWWRGGSLDHQLSVEWNDIDPPKFPTTILSEAP